LLVATCNNDVMMMMGVLVGCRSRNN